MNTPRPVRVRFAPSPTGMMHLGNVRAALLNYLFALQKQGTFIVRIEDTDTQRNFDQGAQHILHDLAWLGLVYQEGPEVGGPYAPYFQSEREAIYTDHLKQLADNQLIYRCFCSNEELEKKRQRQIALKMPPRYDRTCLKLTAEQIKENLDAHKPFIWRMRLDTLHELTINDMAHGPITFDMKNFSDFALTRQDGSATFMFANFVDDMVMHISHVIRGEDHLTNTAGQAALYAAFKCHVPIFWHLPIICNAEGKKLSKRDFGFSLNDLRNAGYLPIAIDNYLATIGSGITNQELMVLPELSHAFNFDKMHSTGHIKYDIEKLRWLNHKWINYLAIDELTDICMPFLEKVYGQEAVNKKVEISKALTLLRTDLHTLAEAPALLEFYFKAPEHAATLINECLTKDQQQKVGELITKHISLLGNAAEFVQILKKELQAQNIPLSHLFWFVRIALMGKQQGSALHELIEILGVDESKKRLQAVL
jgi:glutamyl-tRNA synthetase